MQKIISLFQRDANHLVRNEVTPGAEWVLAGEGVATKKWDGTCCLIRGGKLFRRFVLFSFQLDTLREAGIQQKFEPTGDPQNGKQPGWMPVGDGPEDALFRDTFSELQASAAFSMNCMAEEIQKLCEVGIPDGTYELCGPKINGNPEGFDRHYLIPHGKCSPNAPRTFSELKEWFVGNDLEGIVWWHPDGRMVKIKGKDFGIARPAKQLLKE